MDTTMHWQEWVDGHHQLLEQLEQFVEVRRDKLGTATDKSDIKSPNLQQTKGVSRNSFLVGSLSVGDTWRKVASSIFLPKAWVVCQCSRLL